MERNIRVDNLRLILSFLIIALHSTLFGEFGIFGDMLRSITRIAVPIFLLISGYYFYNIINNKPAIIKYIKRIIILYLIWMLVYLPFYENFSTPFEIKMFILTLINGFFHLWYLPAMIGGVLVLVFFHKFHLFGRYTLIITAIILFLTGWGIQLSKTLTIMPPNIKELISWNFPYRNFLFLGYPFITLGFLIHKNEHMIISLFNQKSWKILIPIFTILLMGEMYLWNKIGLPFEGTDFFITLLFLCPLIFIFAIKDKKMRVGSDKANFSSAIYFIHPLCILLLGGYTTTNFKSWDTYILIATFSLIISVALIEINKKLVRIL